MDNALPNELENEANKYSITILPFEKVEVNFIFSLNFDFKI